MRITQEMEGLTKSPRYPAARQLLEDILNKRQPNMELLTSLYGEHVAISMINSINTFYSNPGFVPGKIRAHDINAPTLLSDARKCMDDDDDFRAMDEYFAPQIARTEDTKTLINEITNKVGRNIVNKFGSDYAQYVIRESALTMHYQLKRKNNISTVCHWMGTAGRMYFLQANNIIPQHSNPNFRVMVAFLHDFKEDLPRKALDKKGKIYGLHRTDEFGSVYLPPEKNLIHNVNILTNLYTEISKFAYESLRDDGLIFTQKSFKEFLNTYIANNNLDTNSSMYKIHRNLLKFMSTKDYDKISGKKLLDTITWDTYEFYVNRIWKKSIRFEDDTPIITKFCDQKDNFTHKEKLSDKDLTQNLLKLWLYGSEIYDSAINLTHTNAFVSELLEDTLCYAEHYILKDFMNTESSILCNSSAFNKIIDFLPILYIEKRLNSAYSLQQKTTNIIL